MANGPQQLVSLDHARKDPDYIPPRSGGKPINSSTLFRWIHKGLEGLDGERIKLSVTYAGNRPHVTKNAIDDFFQAVTAAKLERHRRAEELAADVTADELAAAGLSDGPRESRLDGQRCSDAADTAQSRRSGGQQ